jgi:hypothetical protein
MSLFGWYISILIVINLLIKMYYFLHKPNINLTKVVYNPEFDT